MDNSNGPEVSGDVEGILRKSKLFKNVIYPYMGEEIPLIEPSEFVYVNKKGNILCSDIHLTNPGFDDLYHLPETVGTLSVGISYIPDRSYIPNPEIDKREVPTLIRNAIMKGDKDLVLGVSFQINPKELHESMRGSENFPSFMYSEPRSTYLIEKFRFFYAKGNYHETHRYGGMKKREFW